MGGIDYDVVIVGGGFYGCFVAYQIASRFPHHNILVLEKENALFTGASATNQGQLHKGYMYSIDAELAAECGRNVVLFERHFHDAIDHGVTAYYGIHRDSEIDPAGYERFCRAQGIPLREVDGAARRYFGDEVEVVYASAERTFHSGRLQALMRARMDRYGVRVRTAQRVLRVAPRDGGGVTVLLADGTAIGAGTVYNTAFAGINPLHERSGLSHVPMRCEVFLHFLLGMPAEYGNVGTSVIRGYFASLLPSSFRGGHLLAAAAYRRIRARDGLPPSEHIDEYLIEKVYGEALAGCSGYLPGLRDAAYLGHVIGTRVACIDQVSGEVTSRVTPVLDFDGVPGYHVILGGKVTCLFEALEPALRGMRATGR
ncbi:MAG TPA: FAD-dependent oxidoreductase [Rugosimonospora sp.]|nr:FAD-dependent oxidoreductase [Rugosimonospora sp.]